MSKRILIVSVLLLTAVLFLQAKVRLPHIISDNMIVQQTSKVHLWGWGTRGKIVKVSVSWSVQIYSTTVGKDGRWNVDVTTPRASYQPLNIVFDDGERTVINNVLAGEVWVCAGQSNMEMPLKGFPNCPVEGCNEAIIEAGGLTDKIRFCKIPSRMAMKPLDDASCSWRCVDQRYVSDQSAVGYFFARMMNRALDIPIGLIEANKGGTRVESWLNRENLQALTSEPLDSAQIVRQYSWDYHRPLLWGNGTFSPILGYTVKGILFYQGCSNVEFPSPNYANLLACLVEQWRNGFGQGQLPFYFVQIAPCWYNNDANGTEAAYLREQQLKAQTIIPNSAIVCTNDCVYPWETQQIHPRMKKPVGERLAQIALNRNYGFENIRCESARFDKMRIKGDTCIIFLKNDYQGISRYEDFQGFEIAGDDRVFHKAEVAYDWRIGLMVRSEKVPHPVAVRYCFRNFQLGNVYNQALLPLFPFRTDNW